MFQQNKKDKLSIFFADTSDEISELQQMIAFILESAGMKILYPTEKTSAEKLLLKANCSLHIIGNTYSSNSEEQLDLAKKHILEKENFKIFIWQPVSIANRINTIEQENFVNSLRNGISMNMIYANHESPVLLVEDIRSIMQYENKHNYNLKQTEIFFIYNEIDEDAVKNITDLLGDIVSMQLLSIVLNSEKDYSEYVAQQIEKASLTVIFFKRTTRWALPFVQQVWKKIGGASSKSKIILIGDANHEQNNDLNFTIPNIEFLKVAEELIPLEVKVQYDKLIEA